MPGTKLDEIIAVKREEVAALKPQEAQLRERALARPAEDFRSLEQALRGDGNRLGLISEIKRASPSVGIIRGEVDPVAQGVAYEAAGASGISVLTDEQFFKGSLDDMIRVRQAVSIPVLRKDFMVDESQIFEAAANGADAVLLIVAALEQEELIRLHECARDLGLDVLVEAHDAEEFDRAVAAGGRLIGVNNRNLKNFHVDLAVTEELAARAPADVVLVGESGIKTAADALRMAAAGVDALLVGESLMRAPDLATAVTAFRPAKVAVARG